MQSRTLALFEIHTAVVFMGMVALFAKLIPLPAMVIVLGRVVFASLGLLVFIALTGRLRSLRLHRARSYFLLGLLGVLLAAHWSSFFYSVQISTVAIASIAFSTFPIFVVFIEPLFFRERLMTRDVLLACITFAGIALVIPDYDIGGSSMQGLLWGLVSGVTFAVLSLLNRAYVKNISSLTIAFFQNMVAAFVLLPMLVIQPSHFTSSDVFWLVILGVICTAFAHTIYIQGLKYVPAKRASVISSLEVLYAVLFAVVLLHEIPSLRTIVGGCIVLAAAVYASMKSHPVTSAA
ncbi:MAG TPA: DMT family transporter [Candidatus Peribacteraceae bacterium]|nr:DMT family transporter [Candidatus Peribacteraceae bacterium]